jgi:hypothetical protein
MVSASNSAGGGSVFIGRFNATGSLQENSEQTVFVVGTGTGAGARRNALHIDNQNNTRITGSLLVSGSVNVNGTTNLSGDTTISGNTQMSGNDGFPLTVNGSIQSKRFNFAGNPFNTNSGGTFGSLNYDGNNITLQYTNGDYGTPATSSYTNLTTNTGSNITQVNVGATYGGTTAQTNLINNNGVRSFVVDVDSTAITGSVNITGSLFVNGVDISAGASGSSGTSGTSGVSPSITGFITTGSFGVSQTVSGSLLLSTGPNAGQPTPFVIQPFSNSSSAAVITGSVLISGSLLLNGDTITSINRNGLITTGSNADGEQYITGGLYISSSGNFDKPSLTIKSGPNEGKIGVEGGNFLYRNSLTRNTVVGEVQGISTSTPFTSGSEKNLIFTGFNLGFLSGSNNTVIAGAGGANFISGSNNTILGGVGNLQFGNGNLILGGGKTVTLMENVISIGTNTSPDLLYKSGSVVQMGYSTQITGSLDVSNSLKVLGDVQFSSGSNKTIGTVALDGGNPGVATVSNSLVTASSLIFLTKQTLTNAHMVAVSSKGSGTFTITSNGNGDSDTVAYQIINPA